MKKSLLIVGAGTGLSSSVAERFAKEDYSISLISRNAANLERIKATLASQGADVNYSMADAGDSAALKKAIETVQGPEGFNVVLYNAAVVKTRDIMEETPEELSREFIINVASAVLTIQTTYNGLRKNKGALLLTGGGLAVNPMAAYGSLSIGKAGIRSLAYQLHERLKNDSIYVGLLTVAGFINPESATHSPQVLANIFWTMHQERSQTEIHK